MQGLQIRPASKVPLPHAEDNCSEETHHDRSLPNTVWGQQLTGMHMQGQCKPGMGVVGKGEGAGAAVNADDRRALSVPLRKSDYGLGEEPDSAIHGGFHRRRSISKGPGAGTQGAITTERQSAVA